MRIRLVKGGPVIGSPSHVMNDFSSATEARQAEWEQRLTKNPAAFVAVHSVTSVSSSDGRRQAGQRR